MFSVGRYGGKAVGRYENSGSGRYNRFDQDDLPPYRHSALPTEEESQLAPRFVKGERVRHRRFGSGTIQGLVGAGRDLKVQVKFDDEEAGMKQLLVAYAGLERDWEGA
jgi:hypothetical protein